MIKGCLVAILSISILSASQMAGEDYVSEGSNSPITTPEFLILPKELARSQTATSTTLCTPASDLSRSKTMTIPSFKITNLCVPTSDSSRCKTQTSHFLINSLPPRKISVTLISAQ